MDEPMKSLEQQQRPTSHGTFPTDTAAEAGPEPAGAGQRGDVHDVPRGDLSGRSGPERQPDRWPLRTRAAIAVGGTVTLWVLVALALR